MTPIFSFGSSGTTHSFQRVLALLADPNNRCFVSTASIWEMAIKVSLGKLHLAPNIETFVPTHLKANDFEELPLDQKALFGVARLPFHHRAPFDRLLIAQALT